MGLSILVELGLNILESNVVTLAFYE